LDGTDGRKIKVTILKTRSSVLPIELRSNVIMAAAATCPEANNVDNLFIKLQPAKEEPADNNYEPSWKTAPVQVENFIRKYIK